MLHVPFSANLTELVSSSALQEFATISSPPSTDSRLVSARFGEANHAYECRASESRPVVLPGGKFANEQNGAALSLWFRATGQATGEQGTLLTYPALTTAVTNNVGSPDEDPTVGGGGTPLVPMIRLRLYDRMVRAELGLNNGASTALQSPAMNILDDNWHHVVVEISGGAVKTARLFVDGSAAATTNLPESAGLGSDGDSATRGTICDPATADIGTQLAGAVDDIRFFQWTQTQFDSTQRVLTDAEIAALYHEGYWPP
ncbi:MAG: LamG-like jellyroll fold domain-containing protein [Myxococcota bacterium]